MAILMVSVCAGTSCHLLGNQAIVDVLENMPPSLQKQVEFGYTSCLGDCGEGPCVTIGDKVLKHASPERVLDMIKEELAAKK